MPVSNAKETHGQDPDDECGTCPSKRGRGSALPDPRGVLVGMDDGQPRYMTMAEVTEIRSQAIATGETPAAPDAIVETSEDMLEAIEVMHKQRRTAIAVMIAAIFCGIMAILPTAQKVIESLGGS